MLPRNITPFNAKHFKARLRIVLDLLTGFTKNDWISTIDINQDQIYTHDALTVSNFMLNETHMYTTIKLDGQANASLTPHQKYFVHSFNVSNILLRLVCF
jgi:hypothetical protein